MREVPRPDFSELPHKLRLLADAVRPSGCEMLVLRRQASLSWLFGGRSNVPQTLDAACFDAVIDLTGEAPGITIVVNAIEAPRLRDTEFAGLDADYRVLPWWEPRPNALPVGDRVASDVPYPGAADVSELVAGVRRRLTPVQQADLAELCRDAAAAATSVVPVLRPDVTEYQAAGAMSDALLQLGMDPVVMMVAGAERMPLHRHPLPTTARLGGRAMVVFCARRYGLVASVTRIVSFGPLAAGELERYRAVLEVEGEFLDQTRPGRPIGEILVDAVPAYAANGFDADEWHRHHQGGFSGWEPREFPAGPASRQIVETDSVVAWNPSGQGWKVEDTAIVTDSGPCLLVSDGNWPTVTIRGRERPGIWEV